MSRVGQCVACKMAGVYVSGFFDHCQVCIDKSQENLKIAQKKSRIGISGITENKMTTEFEGYIDHRTIRPEEISQYLGWAIIKILDNQEVAIYQPPSNDLGRGLITLNHNYATPQIHFVVNKPLLLIGRKRDAAIDEMKSELEAFLEQNAQLFNERLAAQKELADTKDKLERLEFERARDASADFESSQRLNTELVEESLRADRMEKDLAKLRKEIGERQFNEIVGAKT